ncbi:WD40 repeat-like protein [Serendipita vermifera]|nr:WD40 repeat-like protein [Serendipita vermifera]
MSSTRKQAKRRREPSPSISDSSQPAVTPEESSSKARYEKTRDTLIQATKVVKAIAGAASFLGPLKSTCELGILFLERTKAINESTEGLKALILMLNSHIAILEDSWHSLQEKQTEPLSTGQRDFIVALEEYIKGLKNTLEKVEQALKERETGTKGLLKRISSSRIEPGVLVAYRDEIAQHSKTFDEATRVCQMSIQSEALKLAQLGSEKPRPMGTQHETCLKGTREPILQEIREWRSSKEIDKRIFWLCDIGGSGKSTVAYTMSQEWRKTADVLLGRFFFSKNARDTADTDTLCSTLARDLASRDPEMSSMVTNALKADTLLAEQDFTEQFSKLIVEPLRSISQDIVFILDAVDECKLESRKRLLRVLLQEIDSLPTLKIFLTSRPESDIMGLLQDKAIVRGMHFKMQGSKNQSNMVDIASYVNHHLTSLLSSKRRDQLVTQSNGLFIWVSTARFELELAADNPTQFESTFNALFSRGTGGDLDALYLGVLNRVLRGRYKDLICRVLATLAILYEPVSVTSLGQLINANDEDLELVVKSMRSVFRVVDTIEFLHPTFREYLNNVQGRGTIPDPYTSHTELALGTLGTLQKDLKKDICNIDVSILPFRDNNDIEDLNERLSALWQQSPSLFYSSQYWALHVSQAIQNTSVIQRLGLFLESKVLNLIELLSLMNHLLRIQDVLGLQSKLEVYWPDNEAIELCNDIWRLVQNRQLLLQRSALHIYTSCLLFLPIETRLAKIYRKQLEGDLPDIVCGSDAHWPHYQTLTGHGDSVEHFSISPDRIRIVSGSRDKTVRMWDATTGASIGNALSVNSTIVYLAFSSDGFHVLIGTESGFLTRWYWSTDKTTSIQLQCNGYVKGLVFSPDETRVIYCNDWGVGSYDTMTGDLISKLFEGEYDRRTNLSSSPDRRRVTCALDSSIHLWDATTGERIGTPTFSHRSIKCLSLSHDNSQIGLGCIYGNIQLWDVALGLRSLTDWKAHEGGINCLAFSPDGTRIVSRSDDGTLRLWDVNTHTSIGVVMKGHVGSISCFAFSSDGNRIVSGSLDGTLRMWDGLTSAGIGEPLEGHAAGITCISFLAGNTRIVSGSNDGTLRLWNVTTIGSVRTIQERHINKVGVIVFSPEGNRVLAGSDDGTLRLWDAETGADIGSAWKDPIDRIECAAFSPDGTRVISATRYSLRLWDVATGASIGESRTPHSGVHRLVFSPDGTKFISCDRDHSMQLWDTTCNPIGKPLDREGTYLAPRRDHGISFFEDGRSFFIEPGETGETGRTGRTFRISYWGIEKGFLSLPDPRSRPTDAETIFRDGCLIMRGAPRHTFMLPAEWKVTKWTAHRAKIALGFHSGRVMVLDFSKFFEVPGIR